MKHIAMHGVAYAILAQIIPVMHKTRSENRRAARQTARRATPQS